MLTKNCAHPRQSQISVTKIGLSISLMLTFIFNQERNRERFAKFMASANLTFIFGEDPKI